MRVVLSVAVDLNGHRLTALLAVGPTESVRARSEIRATILLRRAGTCLGQGDGRPSEIEQHRVHCLCPENAPDSA